MLVVDDDISYLKMFERAFKHDFVLTIAWSGLEALDLLAEKPFDVLITDYSMPGLNGLALLRRAEREHPEVARMLMTGRPELDFIADARADGIIQAVIAKPWDALTMRDRALALYRKRTAAA